MSTSGEPVLQSGALYSGLIFDFINSFPLFFHHARNAGTSGSVIPAEGRERESVRRHSTSQNSQD